MSSSSSKGTSEKTSKKDPKLPWWVELLFVQIGLPDKWLPRFLKYKSNYKKLLLENDKKIIYIMICLIGLAYLQPSYKFYRRQNLCIESSIKQIEENPDQLNNLNSLSRAINYCNGSNN